jgi:OmpA-OmpF porin, OOP family
MIMILKKSACSMAVAFAAFGILNVMGCASSAPNSGIASSANPAEEIQTQSQKMSEARDANVDVLARKEYKKAERSLAKAKDDLADGDKQEKILNDIRFSKTYLAQAYAKAGDRQSKAPGLFEARQNALKAGAATQPNLTNEFRDIDDRTVDVADRLGKESAEDLAEIQAAYVNLERKAVIGRELGTAQAKVKGAEENDAEDRSPQTLKKAQMAVSNADSVISTNVRNPAAYASAVKAANDSATLLDDVTKTIAANGKGLSEASAIKLVMQNRQIVGLKTDLNTSQGETQDAEQSIADKNATLRSQRSELNAAESSVALQKAIEDSRKSFSADEAEAYQQGGNLVIRLKKMNFASSRSDLPAQSLPVLAKVSEVAKSLGATEIKVEGHTDSVGTSQANKTLSEKRANSVATYLKNNGFQDAQIEAEGMGFEKPIATNKSKEGRAQNRRVDIIITPEAASTVR